MGLCLEVLMAATHRFHYPHVSVSAGGCAGPNGPVLPPTKDVAMNM